MRSLNEWQFRSLNAVYPTYLSGLRFDKNSLGQAIDYNAVYLALGIYQKSHKESFGL